MLERERKVKSGPLLEVDFYPVFSDGRRIPSRPGRRKRTAKQQAAYNRLCAVKRFVRLINANFDENDYLMHPTYTQDEAPITEEEARRDIDNALRRIKYARNQKAKHIRLEIQDLADGKMTAIRRNKIEQLKQELKILERKFKYAYTVEHVIYRTGSKIGQKNYHFHLFVSGGLTERELKDKWSDKARVRCDNFRPRVFGPESAARYMCKSERLKGKKAFVCSKGLNKPKIPEPKDGKITPGGVAKIARDRVDDAAYWERRHPGYKFIRCFTRWNEYNSCWYVSVVMYKSERAMPKGFVIDDWIEDEDIAEDIEDIG